MPDDAEAQKAIAELNGKEVQGRTLTVNVARPRTERPAGSGMRRGGGGGGRY
jgi:RNA recognition motif-containing protein